MKNAEEFPLGSQPPPAALRPRKARYEEDILRYYGFRKAWVRNDALHNWARFEKYEQDFLRWIRAYKADSGCPDGAGKAQNPSGSLGGLAWDCIIGAGDITGHRAELLDFDDQNQRLFLRRGMISYLKCLAQEIEAARDFSKAVRGD